MARKHGSTGKRADVTRIAVFWLAISLLVLIPLAFNTNQHRIYVTYKLALLLVGASALIPMVAFTALGTAHRRSRSAGLFKLHLVIVTSLYTAVILTSTLLSGDPVASLFGHFYNQMGLITRFCFLVCFIGVIVGIDLNQTRFETALWAITFAGLLVSAYAVAQSFGYDPLLPSVLYTSDSPEGAVVRVIGTLGHADYLGNFLLYTTPLGAGVAIAARGQARVLALLATVLSIVAIVFSGTRGAWVGLVSATVVFGILKLRDGPLLPERRPQAVRAASLAFLVILVLSLAITLSPASRSIVARARLSFTEGFTGAGRTDLWRDSIKMVPAFALTGSGPDNFRKTFLPYKSRELGRIVSLNSESSHNSYLDAAISFGLPGFLLYFGIIVSTFRLLLGALRRTSNPRMKIMTIGIVSSLGGVVVHNFFIFDQIPTGLYFFAFAALGQVVSKIVDAKNLNTSEVSNQKTGTPAAVPTGIAPAPENANRDRPKKGNRPLIRNAGWAGRMIPVTGCVLVAVVVWYSVALVRADAAINRAMISADAGDLNKVISNGEQAADSPEFTGEYNFLFARALVLCADRLNMSSRNLAREDLNAAVGQAIDLAAARARKSLAHTLTPDVNYLLLAYLSLVKNDVVNLRAYADEAAGWDPNHTRTRWMLAESYLASGDRNRAAQEAEAALDLDPTSSEAKSVLARARGETSSLEARIEEIIARARESADRGQVERARRLLDRALELSNGQCPECHRALALVYEAGNQYQNAIDEWQIFMRQTPDQRASEQIAGRIEALRQKR